MSVHTQRGVKFHIKIIINDKSSHVSEHNYDVYSIYISVMCQHVRLSRKQHSFLVDNV